MIERNERYEEPKMEIIERTASVLTTSVPETGVEWQENWNVTNPWG